MPDKSAFLPSNSVFKSNTPRPEGQQQRYIFFFLPVMKKTVLVQKSLLLVSIKLNAGLAQGHAYISTAKRTTWCNPLFKKPVF